MLVAKNYLLFILLLALCLGCYSQNKVDSLGRKQGPWYSYSINGLPREQGVYINDLKVGVWRTYSPSGILTDSGSYSNGKKTGRWMQRFDGGDYVSGDRFVDYYVDSGLTIWDNRSAIYINEDSTYLSLTINPDYKQVECQCKNKVSGKFDCVKYYYNKDVSFPES
ncbi:MAG: hypothetical protein MUE96_04105 [Bacteroidia bacterium]|jgi:antitoxin component YwqK of YwqJK toxin-antitoxin module|nr:hypothetical protein [Bacteroidia bacterium]